MPINTKIEQTEQRKCLYRQCDIKFREIYNELSIPSNYMFNIIIFWSKFAHNSLTTFFFLNKINKN